MSTLSRLHLELWHRILKVIAGKEEICRTHVISKSNTTAPMLRYHLEEMEEKDLIKKGKYIRNKNCGIIITDKGYNFIKNYETLIKDLMSV